MKTSTKLLAAGCAALCFAGVVFAQKQVDAHRAKHVGEQLLYLPNEKLLNHFSAGMSSVIADFLWIECLQYTGKHARTDREFRWLKQMIETVVRLDPYFVDVYLNGGIFLASLEEDSGDAIDLLQRGFIQNPKAWELPHQIAMIYLIDRKGQYGSERLALHYLTMSAATGRAPERVADLAAKLQGDYNLDDIEEEMWTKSAREGDKLMQDLAARKLQELGLRRNCEALSGILRGYEERMGRVPASLEELVRAGVLRELPEDPLGGRYFLDDTGTVQNTTLLDGIKEQRAGLLRGRLDRYREEHGTWPPDLQTLVAEGLLQELPEQPYPGEDWRYNPETGAVE